MFWLSTNFIFFVILILLRNISGSKPSSDDKGKNIYPHVHLDQSSYLKSEGKMFDENNSGEGQRSSEFPSYSQEKESTDFEYLDYDALMNLDYVALGLNEGLPETFLEDQPIAQKRRSRKLIPRIGRKKRSTDDEGKDSLAQCSKDRVSDGGIPWSDLIVKRGVFIPRTGSPSVISTVRIPPVIRIRHKSRGSFIPRIG